MHSTFDFVFISAQSISVRSCLIDSGMCSCTQKAHVQQFLATEDALNKAAEARDLCQKLVKRLHGSGDVVSSNSLGVGGASQNVGSLRQFEVDIMVPVTIY